MVVVISVEVFVFIELMNGLLYLAQCYHQQPSDEVHGTDQCLNLAVHRVSGQYDDHHQSSCTHGGSGHHGHHGTQ